MFLLNCGKHAEFVHRTKTNISVKALAAIINSRYSEIVKLVGMDKIIECVNI